MTSAIPTASASAGPPDVLREGITVLFDNTNAVSGKKGADYVFLHGLNGHPKSAWTNAKGFYWPWQLRNDLRSARVMVFGYNADFEISSTTNQISIKAIAESFISAIIDEREDIDRPLIIIAHSLGGLVIKKALITIHQSRSAGKEGYYVPLQNKIYDSIKGLVFFGTPHAGSHVVGKKRVQMLQQIARVSFKKAPPKIVKALEAHSDELLKLSDDFENTTIFTRHEINICTYYETRTAKLLGEEVVPEAMTVLHYQNERREGIPADHENIVKYAGPQDQNYQRVVKELRRIGTCQKLDESAPDNLDSAIKIVEKYVEDASEDLERRRLDMEKLNIALGDLKWFTKMPEYITWSSADYAALLWFASQPRSGKTTVLQNLVAELQDRCWRNGTIKVAYFFCPEPASAEQASSKSHILPGAILSSIISQLLGGDYDRIAKIQLNSNLEKRLGKTLEKILSSNDTLQETLWELLRLVIKEMQGQKMYIIIDGIDKMKAEAQTEFLKGLRKLRDTLLSMSASMAKFLISSSPSTEIRDVLKGILLIDENIERKYCLNSLFFSELHARRDKVSEPQQGTYQWIWKHPAYKKWLEKQSGILWIQGKPGSGKSTLARMIQRALQSEHEAGPNEAQIGIRGSIVADFFYSARGAASETSHRWMLQSLLHQVLEQEPRIFKLFESPFRRLLGESPGRIEWSYSDLKTILLSLPSCDIPDTQWIPGYKIYFLLDAMDESEDENKYGRQRAEVLSLLTELCSMSGRITIKIIIASRPANEIEKKLKRFHHIELQKENTADVEKVVDAGLRLMWETMYESGDGNESCEDSDSNPDSGQPDQSSLLAVNAANQSMNDNVYKKDLEFVGEYLTRNADGVILWVVLILGKLLVYVGRGSHSINEIKDKLKELPTDLKSTYKEIIGTLQKKHNMKDIAQGQLMLTWASFAKRPLTVKEFRDAIAVPTGSQFMVEQPTKLLHENRINIQHRNWAPIKNRIVDMCGGLLEVVRPNSKSSIKIHSKTRNVKQTYVVQLLHQTVKDFLVHNKYASPLDLDQTKAKCLIATALLRYLTLSLPMKDLKEKQVPDWGQEEYKKFVEYLLDRPLLDYVLSFLPQHILDSDDMTRLELAKFLRQLEDEPQCHAWAFLNDWCREELLLPSDKFAASPLAKSFKTNCLLAAAEAGHADIVRVVLDAGENLEGKITWRKTALHWAAENRNEAVVRLLLEKGADVNAIGFWGGRERRTALHLAAESGHEAVVRLLLEKGADVEVKGFLQKGEGRTALHMAAENGHEAVVQLLLEKGADVEAKGFLGEGEGRTALHLAAENGHEAVVQLLQSTVRFSNVSFGF